MHCLATLFRGNVPVRPVGGGRGRAPFVLAALLIALPLQAQPPDLLWSRAIGGANIDIGHAVEESPDGGFVVAGYTRSDSVFSGRNAWLVKSDAAGNPLWSRVYGGDDDDEAHALHATADGGYIVAGFTKSLGVGQNDVFLIKTDSAGIAEWTRTFGGGNDDEAYAVQQTRDGGYIVAGVTSSFATGGRDLWLIRTDSLGNELWSRNHGGFGSDGAWSVRETADGGFIAAGWTFSSGPGFLGNAWLLRTDSLGFETWNAVFGGDDADRAYDVRETRDGGFVFTGYTGSSGAGLYDLMLVKTDSAGTELWSRTFGGSGRDYGNAVWQTADGGYIATGYTLSFGAGGEDLWIVRTDSAGMEMWRQTYGGSASDVGYDVRQTGDGGFVAAGHTLSSGTGLHDLFLVRLAADLAPQFAVTPDSLFLGGAMPGDSLADSLVVRNDGGLVLVIDSVTVSDPQFTVTPSSAAVAPGAGAGFRVVFRADSSIGSHRAVLRFVHNGASSPDSVAVRAEVLTGISGNATRPPARIVLSQNYPNPFNPTTTIRYRLDRTARVILTVFDPLGRRLATLVDARQSAGNHEVTFDGTALGSGFLFYRIEAEGTTITRKMLLLR